MRNWPSSGEFASMNPKKKWAVSFLEREEFSCSSLSIKIVESLLSDV